MPDTSAPEPGTPPQPRKKGPGESFKNCWQFAG